MEIKVISERDPAKFQAEVNKFVGETSDVQIQFSTTQYGEGEIMYSAFIIYQ